MTQTIDIADTLLTEQSDSADRRRGTVGGMALTVLNALVLALGLALVMAYGGTQVSEAEWVGTPSMAQERELSAQHDAEARAMVAAQVAALGCATKPALTDRVAVRSVKVPDSGVVRVVTFDEGWALAQSGKVYVEGYCS